MLIAVPTYGYIGASYVLLFITRIRDGTLILPYSRTRTTSFLCRPGITRTQLLLRVGFTFRILLSSKSSSPPNVNPSSSSSKNEEAPFSFSIPLSCTLSFLNFTSSNALAFLCNDIC